MDFNLRYYQIKNYVIKKMIYLITNYKVISNIYKSKYNDNMSITFN